MTTRPFPPPQQRNGMKIPVGDSSTRKIWTAFCPISPPSISPVPYPLRLTSLSSIMDGGDAFLGSMRRRSGIDFDDVFGGPPTRSSYGSRRSGEEVVGSLSSSGREVDGGGLQTASLRTSFGDMPVFGEAYSPSPRRKGLSDDFYSDIFRGGVSGSSTPRRLDWDTLSSAPGSRILSPARTVVPRTEPADGFALSPLSVTEKLEKVQGSPAAGFSPDHFLGKTEHTAAHTTNQMAHEKLSDPLAEWDRDSHHSFHRNDLSFQNFHGKDVSRDSDDSGSICTDENLSQDSTHSKDKKKSYQFHFSIYKWASKGVMLVVPSSPKEKIKTGGRFSGLPVPFLHGVDLPLSKKNLSSSDRIFPSEFEKHDAEACGESESTTESSEAANRTSHTTDFSEAADRTSRTTEFSQAANRTSDQKFESMPFPTNDTIATGMPVKPQVLVSGNETNIRDLSKDDNNASGLVQEQEKPTLQKLFDLIKEHTEGPDGEQVDDMEGSLHRTTSARNADCQTETRQQASKTTMTDHTNAERIQSKCEIPPGRVKGKVKDFMKAFNQDVSCKPMNFCEPQSRSAKAEDMENNAAIDHGKEYVNKFDWEDKSKSDSNDAVESSEPLVKSFVMDEKLKFDASAEIQQILDYFSKKNEDSISTIDRNLGNTEASNGDTDDLYFEVEECTVEQVVFHLADTDDVPQFDSNVEELQNSDTRIREWSSGKEGNIRSLLSTLQYVLWPGSGWKVVPLVDLIESSSVRRSYQRALLCLHPDKLQQRGAPAHQKYVAEKVFDVLQEAWNQFSSVSPI